MLKTDIMEVIADKADQLEALAYLLEESLDRGGNLAPETYAAAARMQLDLIHSIQDMAGRAEVKTA